jgi:hypothetical protein
MRAMEAVMSTKNTPTLIIVALNCPRTTKEVITYARVVLVALQGNDRFSNPPLPYTVFAEDIVSLEEAETNAATRAKGAAALRDAKLAKVKDDLGQYRSYVQSVVLSSASSIDAAALVESANMSIRRPPTRNTPEIGAKNADVSGKVILAAKSLGSAVIYSWEYSLDQENWTPIADTRKARTELSGLTKASTYYFRFRANTRAGIQDYSPVVSLVIL